MNDLADGVASAPETEPSITFRRSDERRCIRHGAQETWLTDVPQSLAVPLAAGEGPLRLITEDHIAPRGRFVSSLDRDAEVVTYVCQGTLEYDDPSGRSRVILAGEFHRASARRKIHRSCRNGSRKHALHVFQIGLRAAAGRSQSSTEQKRFCAAERRGLLCVVASPDGRNGSLCILHDALIHSAIVSPGQHVVHELAAGRSAWLHVVRGQAALGQVVLFEGDGAGVSAARAVSLTATEETELLLLDVRDYG